jgi:dipeptidyl aminopeptidase/acylaminoacyl peptidase
MQPGHAIERRGGLLPSLVVPPRYRTIAPLVGLLAAGAAVAPSYAVAAATLSPRQLLQLQRVREVQLAPDGRRIAYLLEVPRRLGREPDGPAWQRLRLVDERGASRVLVGGRVRVQRFRWTADGRAIVYLASTAEVPHPALHRVDTRSGRSSLLWQHGTAIENFALDPGGRHVAFVAREALPARTAAGRKQGFDAEVVDEQWRPSRVWIVAARGVGRRARKLPLPGSASTLAWDPKGKRLLVALAPTPSADDFLLRRRLQLVDAADGRVRGTIETVGKLGPAAFSPDGRQIALIASQDRRDPRPGRLMVVSSAGGRPRQLLPGLRGHVRAFVWQGSSRLLYLADLGVHSELGLVSTRGGATRKVWLAARAGQPVYDAFDLSADGRRIALVGQGRGHPAEVYLLGASERHPRRLTDHNPGLEGVTLSSQEVVEYRARDGLRLQGILVRPPGPRPERGHPLILAVHGGPARHVRDGWVSAFNAPAQVAAARGFAVFFPNYRGSSGRGVAFSKRGQGDYGGREFDDLVDAIRHLARRGLIDRRRVGIVGGSYGGYAAAWAATRLTRHFAAAVMIAGISDHVAKMGTSSIVEESYQLHALRWPWEAPRWYRERSPLSHVRRARTPLLIAHGKRDPVLPPSQAMMLYRYLKLIGKVPLRLVLYPREGHGLRRRASRADLCLRILRWMAHYLEGPGGKPPPSAIDLAPLGLK